MWGVGPPALSLAAPLLLKDITVPSLHLLYCCHPSKREGLTGTQEKENVTYWGGEQYLITACMLPHTGGGELTLARPPTGFSSEN